VLGASVWATKYSRIRLLGGLSLVSSPRAVRFGPSVGGKVADETIVSHTLVMNRRAKSLATPRGAVRGQDVRVQVAELKARLSEYIRAAEGGKTVVVTAYGRPVVDLVAHREGAQPIRIRPATRRWGSVKLPRTGSGRTDSLALLMEERRNR